MARGWPIDFVAGPFSVIPNVSVKVPGDLVVHHTPWQEDVIPTLERIAGRGETRAILHAMAVLDYIPEISEDAKRPSGKPWPVTLVPTPKIIDRMHRLFPRAPLIAFKLEVGVEEALLRDRARNLAKRTGARLVVGNLLDWVRDGHYRCLIIDKTGAIKERLTGRKQTATYLWNYLEEVLANDLLTR
jgi:phosphopantothenoylcysteine synthetase/decarboxylase